MKKRYIIEMIFPIICIIVGILLSGYATTEYINDCQKVKWQPTEAIVTDMDSYVTSVYGSRHTRRNRTIYIITYNYEVNGIEYTNEIRSEVPSQVDRNINIKYNPDEPSKSTTITAPDTSLFIIVFFGIVLIFGGVIFTVIIWKNRFVFTDIEYDKSEPYYQGPNQKSVSKSYLKTILFFACFLILTFVLMYFQPFAQKNINSNDFVQIMQSEGYTAENSLDKTQKEFGMGSIITESYSVNTYNIRIDYCVLNSNKNAKLLYDSASLSADTYTITDKQFLGSQDNEFFYCKAYINNTFVYGACKIEQKDKLLQILKDMGYYSK
ncbi:DUF3592 domain-containing protein [uncultured Eubacterium sp.]|uniref:DUF3592 domain-containing protein n=1 Tax=uncultured Eubacterium sp. TaxID=165185 RepID=UPI0025E98A1C|nr:DUF3592 domain-containing protein [uncultured Eubacterium sp.]